MGGFTVTYLDAGQVERQEDLTAAATLALEDAPPVRTFPSYHGQRHYPGLWWSATLGRHVGYESWLERDSACMLDFDPGVVAFASQPFWLRWEQDGRACSHVPDWFARLADGTGVVLDCRPADQVRPKDAAVFKTTARLGPARRSAGGMSWWVATTRCCWPTCAGWPAPGIRATTSSRSPARCWRRLPSPAGCWRVRLRLATRSPRCRSSTTCSGRADSTST